MSARFVRATALLAAGVLSAAAARAQSPCAAPLPVSRPQERTMVATYQVADLVVPVEPFGTAPGNPEKPGKTAKKAATQEERLTRLIQDSIAPASWASRGGVGTIDYFPMTMTLVVNQTLVIQEQIADLLAHLRREQDTQVALEVRLVSIPEGFARVGVDFNVAVGGQEICPAVLHRENDRDHVASATRRRPSSRDAAAWSEARGRTR